MDFLRLQRTGNTTWFFNVLLKLAILPFPLTVNLPSMSNKSSFWDLRGMILIHFDKMDDGWWRIVLGESSVTSEIFSRPTGRENCPRDRVFQILCLCGFEHDRGMLPDSWWQTIGLLQQHLRYASGRWVRIAATNQHPTCVFMWYMHANTWMCSAVQRTRYL